MNDQNTRASAARCSSCGTMHPIGEPCPTADAERTGMVLDGKYAISRLLGQGGMGEVYEARHTKIGRRVAVKFLHGQFAKRPEVARRFENEARAAGEVEHENIAGVYDVGALPDGTQYLVMEFLDGEDLDHVLRREHRFPPARAADLLMQACQGLAVVHPRGIVHRDLKPANLFLTKRANGGDLVKVLDFGIAKLRRPEGDASATETGVALGTAYYMSPEQARGERDIGPRSDIYALGVILYELLSGRRPHDGTSLLQILHQILTQPPTPLEETSPGLPLALYAIVRKAMAANAADRFAGVEELAAALAPFAAGTHRASSPGIGEGSLHSTRYETGASGGSLVSGAAQSVAGVASGRSAAAGRGRGIALVATAAALVLIGVEGFLFAFGKGNFAPTPAPAITAVATPAAAAPPPAVAAPVPPPSAPSLPAATASAAASAATPAPAASTKEAPPADAPAPSPSAHPEDVAPAEHHHHGQGASPSSHGAAAATPAVAAHASAHPGAAPAAGAGKPDCTQTYSIDSEGNKHFRPECFPPK